MLTRPQPAQLLQQQYTGLSKDEAHSIDIELIARYKRTRRRRPTAKSIDWRRGAGIFGFELAWQGGLFPAQSLCRL
jgi:hypothetical protein